MRNSFAAAGGGRDVVELELEEELFYESHDRILSSSCSSTSASDDDEHYQPHPHPHLFKVYSHEWTEGSRGAEQNRMGSLQMLLLPMGTALHLSPPLPSTPSPIGPKTAFQIPSALCGLRACSYSSPSSSSTNRSWVVAGGGGTHHRSCGKRQTWLCGHIRRDGETDNWTPEGEGGLHISGSDDDLGAQVPTQAQSIVEGSGILLVSEYKPIPDIDYLQELLAIQQEGPRAIGFFGTRNMGFMHQQLIEILSYAMVITKNHIYTSGASGTNAAVIRGALRAEKPELLTVILPQSLSKQPPESQELLAKVPNLIEKPQNDHLPLIEASRLCNMDIISHVQQVICFAFHDSKLLMETCREAKNLRKIVTLFYLD